MWGFVHGVCFNSSMDLPTFYFDLYKVGKFAQAAVFTDAVQAAASPNNEFLKIFLGDLRIHNMSNSLDFLERESIQHPSLKIVQMYIHYFSEVDNSMILNFSELAVIYLIQEHLKKKGTLSDDMTMYINNTYAYHVIIEDDRYQEYLKKVNPHYAVRSKPYDIPEAKNLSMFVDCKAEPEPLPASIEQGLRELSILAEMGGGTGDFSPERLSDELGKVKYLLINI